VTSNGIDARDHEVESLGEGERVVSLCTATIDGNRPSRQSHLLDQLVEDVGASRVQASV